jgi:hypothetical protein
MALDLERPASSPTLLAPNAERARKSKGGAIVVGFARARPKRAVPGRVSEGEPKFEEVVFRIRKDPDDTRQTKDPEGA